MLELRGVSKRYHKGDRTIHAARDLTFGAEEGDMIVVEGPSGSGKSTLLLIIGGMLRPDSGQVLYDSSDVYGQSRSRRNLYRKRTVGFVFQRFFLMPYLSVYDNIRVPLALQHHGRDPGDAIRDLARRLGLEDRLEHKPAELSVGEQQRAALARALVAGQKLVLADEPTGNLDVENVRLIADCLIEENRRGRTIVMATHNPALLETGTRRLRIEHGGVVEAVTTGDTNRGRAPA